MFQIAPAVHLHNIIEQAPQLGTGPDTLLRIPEKLRVELNDNALSRVIKKEFACPGTPQRPGDTFHRLTDASVRK